MNKVLIVVGTRPNFVKIAPLIKHLKNYKILHTGQHYSNMMSKGFLKGLGIPEPDYNLNVGSGAHAEQTASIMSLFEPICIKEQPDIVIVVGDVNSTLACSLVVSKIPNIKLAHIESGERSFDRSMPEEVNRVIVDHISDYLFCSTENAVNNLLHEGISNNKIHLVGNIVIDNLVEYEKNITTPKPHTLFTLHRPSNTDNKNTLTRILSCINNLNTNVVFPIHPRTKKRIEQWNLSKYISNIEVVEPLGYLEFMSLLKNAKCVITDSGGIQVESAYFETPCITLRNNTEHTFTLKRGVNVLVGNDMDKFEREYYTLKFTNIRIYDPLWDGKVSERIINILNTKENKE